MDTHRPLDVAGPSPDGAHALLRAIEERTGSGSWEWRPADGALWWSVNARRLLGLPAGTETTTVKEYAAYVHDDDRDDALAAMGRLGATGELERPRHRIVRPDGVVRHLELALVRVERRDGRPRRVVGAVYDVTAHVRAQREIGAHRAVAEALVRWDARAGGAQALVLDLTAALGCATGVLWVPRGSVLAVHALASTDDRLRGYESSTRRASLGRGTGPAGAAWAGHGPIVGALARSRPVPRRRAAARAGLHGAIAFPAMHGDEVLAVLELSSREAIEATDSLMRTLSALGAQLGLFLTRHRGDLGVHPLTSRELEVLRLGARGLSAPQTAERLVIATATVKSHYENIYAKLNVSDKASAVATALRHGLID
jgi:PAS domain S-box-containing protein